jgi:hypothetical protein
MAKNDMFYGVVMFAMFVVVTFGVAGEFFAGDGQARFVDFNQAVAADSMVAHAGPRADFVLTAA